MSAVAGVDHALRRRVHAELVATDAIEELASASPEVLRGRLGELLHAAEPLLAVDRHDDLVRQLAAEVTGLGPLEPLLADPTVTEVMVNGPGRCFVERAGRLEAVPLELDASGILRAVERILGPLALRIDRASPMVDARLPDGSRLHAVIPPLAIDGPCLTIRRFGARPVPAEAFGVGPTALGFLRWAVDAGWNLMVSGGTGAGKTTLLNGLSGAIGAGERVLTIEETAELRLAGAHVVRLEARPANAEGAGAVSVRDLVRAALRMRPDRIVVGEVRGGEAFDLLQALNTGHEGTLSTIHANSPRDALRRLATLALLGGTGLPHEAIREQVTVALDAVVQVERSNDGSRRVTAIAEVRDDPSGFAVRELFGRGASGLEARRSPLRPPRRSEVAAWTP
ncbi:MAG: CpaF family protein [Actinobacteria bacterium]|nr:CpaF family protein [Actinomycetota bacterium]